MTPCEADIFQAHHRRSSRRGGRGHNYVVRSPAHKKKYEKQMKAYDRAQERYSVKQGEYLEARIRSILEEAEDAKKEWAKHVKFSPGRRPILAKIQKIEKLAEELNKEWFSKQNRKELVVEKKVKSKKPHDREKSRR